MELFVIIVLAVLALWAFSNTENGQAPIITKTEPEEKSGSVIASLALIALILFFSAGALIGGGDFDTQTYSDIRTAGGDDAVGFISFVVAIGCGGLLMMVNGVAPRLGLIIFLGCVVSSVLVSEIIIGGL